MDVIRKRLLQLLLENQDVIVQNYRDGLEAMRPRLSREEDAGAVEMIPDLPTRLRVVASLIEQTGIRRTSGRLGRATGYVYFIRGGDWIKIGYSQLPAHFGRLTELQVGCPFELSIVGERRGTVADERALHKRYAEDRVQGEWFRATPELLEEAAATDGQPVHG